MNRPVAALMVCLCVGTTIALAAQPGSADPKSVDPKPSTTPGTTTGTPTRPGDAKPSDSKSIDGKPADVKATDDKAARTDPAAEAQRVGPMHKWMNQLEGSWIGEVRDIRDGKIIDWRAKMDISVRLAGRFAIADFSGRSDGRFVSGHGVLGYNNETAKFERSWCANDATGMTLFTGTIDKDQRAITLSTEPLATLNGKPARRWVLAVTGKDTLREEWYMTKPNAEGRIVESLVMDVNYTRGVLPETADEKREGRKN